jgi:hypothetical protein
LAARYGDLDQVKSYLVKLSNLISKQNKIPLTSTTGRRESSCDENLVTKFSVEQQAVCYSNKFIDIDVAALCLCLVECICRFGSCCLHQSRFPGRSLCYIDDNAFLGTPAAVMVVVVVVVVVAVIAAVLADFSAQGNYVAH